MLTEEEKARNREANRIRQEKLNRNIWIIVGLFLFLCFFGRFFWGMIGVNIPFSTGERKVQIVKIASRGLIWKTWEVEGIMAPGHGIATTYVWDFSIDNFDQKKNYLLQELTDAYKLGKTVSVKYEQMAGSVPWRGKTNYFAKDVVEATEVTRQIERVTIRDRADSDVIEKGVILK